MSQALENVASPGQTYAWAEVLPWYHLTPSLPFSPATATSIGSIGDHLYPPQLAPTQDPRGVSNFVDGSGPTFSMYLEMATEEDKKMVEGWKADADGILIFTGLFSAAVASLISVSIQDIRPNPQDTSNFYLANIYQTLANPNRSNIPGSLPTSPPPFSPPNYAVWGMQRTAEETALDLPSEIDARTLMWTFDSLDEDHELERFFSGLPGFRSSKFVKDPLPCLTEEQKEKLSTALIGLLDVTFSSDLLPEPVKNRRAIICAKASDPAHIPKVSGIFNKILSRFQYSGPMCTEIVQIMNGWGNNRGNDARLVATVCRTITRAQHRDDSWFILVSNELGVQEPILREYAAHGDSLSLAILIHIIRQRFSHFREEPWSEYEFLEILEAASKFNVQDTSHDLQHEFCALWNQIVPEAQNVNSWWMAPRILKPILDVYIALHQETDPAPIGENLWYPSSYPLCNVPGHRLDPTSHAHDGSTSMSFSHITSLVSASIACSEVSSLSVPALPHADESITGVPPLGNFHPQTAHQTTREGLSIPVTSPDPATSDTFVTSGINVLATSTSASPHSSASPSTALALQHNVDPLALSDPPNPPPLAVSNLLLDNILPTESRHPIVDVVSPSVSPDQPLHLVWVLLSRTVATRILVCARKRTPLTPSLDRAIHANDMVTDLPPHSPPPPHLLQYPYDIV